MGNQQLVFHSRQCSSTLVGFGLRFLNKEQYDNTEALGWLQLIFTVPWTENSSEGKALL
jgi:hypothetical protein